MAAFDAFLKIDGIPGESADKGHPKEIDVLSFSFGVNQQVAQGVGAAGGKADIQDFSFVHFVDAASPRLFLAACQGQHIKDAVFTVRKAGENPVEYLKITLSDILVASMAPAGSAGGDFLPMEQVSLNFSKIEFSYKPQGREGGTEPAITAICGGHKQ